MYNNDESRKGNGSMRVRISLQLRWHYTDLFRWS